MPRQLSRIHLKSLAVTSWRKPAAGSRCSPRRADSSALRRASRGPFCVTEPPFLNYTWEQRTAAPLPHLCLHQSSLWRSLCEANWQTCKVHLLPPARLLHSSDSSSGRVPDVSGGATARSSVGNNAHLVLRGFTIADYVVIKLFPEDCWHNSAQFSRMTLFIKPVCVFLAHLFLTLPRIVRLEDDDNRELSAGKPKTTKHTDTVYICIVFTENNKQLIHDFLLCLPERFLLDQTNQIKNKDGLCFI